MLFDVYMIVITAFALFGMFCLAEQIIMAIKYGDSPKSVTILRYDAHIKPMIQYGLYIIPFITTK